MMTPLELEQVRFLATATVVAITVEIIARMRHYATRIPSRSLAPLRLDVDIDEIFARWETHQWGPGRGDPIVTAYVHHDDHGHRVLLIWTHCEIHAVAYVVRDTVSHGWRTNTVNGYRAVRDERVAARWLIDDAWRTIPDQPVTLPPHLRPPDSLSLDKTGVDR